MKTKTVIDMNVVKSAAQIQANAARPAGYKAGKAVQAASIVAVSTVAAAAGTAWGSVSGFFKGLTS